METARQFIYRKEAQFKEEQDRLCRKNKSGKANSKLSIFCN
jgi:hypothetical protein